MLLVDDGMMLWLCIDKSCLNSTAVRNPRELVFRNKLSQPILTLIHLSLFVLNLDLGHCGFPLFFFILLSFLFLFSSSSPHSTLLCSPLYSPLFLSPPISIFPPSFFYPLPSLPSAPLNFLPLHYLFISLPPSSLLLYLPSDTQIWRDSG